MDFLEIFKTIKEDWAILVFFFTLGGVWMQGKIWFDNVNKKLQETSTTHQEQNDVLSGLVTKIDLIEEHVNCIRTELTSVHEEVHEQEIKLAVLENTRPAARRRKSKA